MRREDDDLRVADMMTIDPVSVRAEADIDEAEELLRRYHVSGLPVVDEHGALVGVISQTDLLYLAAPSVRALIRRSGSEIRVGEVMSVPPVTIESSAPLTEAARVMHGRRLHRLVVVDGDAHPTGVLSAMDFVALAADA